MRASRGRCSAIHFGAYDYLSSLGIAGGVVLFLIALRMIFPSGGGLFGDLPPGEWMPTNTAFWCAYAVQFIDVLRGYGAKGKADCRIGAVMARTLAAPFPLRQALPPSSFPKYPGGCGGLAPRFCR